MMTAARLPTTTSLLAASVTMMMALTATIVGAVNLTMIISPDGTVAEQQPNIAWTFSNLLTNDTEVNYQGNLLSASPAEEKFGSLMPGGYRLVVDNYDNTSGTVTFVDADSADELWATNLTDNELIVYVDVANNTENVSFTEVPDMIWPGSSSNATSNSFTVNVKFDNMPETVSILLLIKDDTYFNTGWFHFDSYQGVAADANTIWTQTYEPADVGLYYFRVRGATTNGWVTVTNKTNVMWHAMAPFQDAGEVECSFVVKGYHGYTELFTVPPSARATLPP